MKVNKKPVDYRIDKSARLAGGYGPHAAKQDAEALLRRAVMACLLWENGAYENGVSIGDNIKNLIPQVEPQKVLLWRPGISKSSVTCRCLLPGSWHPLIHIKDWSENCCH